MVSSSSSAAQAPLGASVSKKLTRENFLLWKAQIMPAIRGAQLTGILDGTSVTPDKTVGIMNEDKTKVIIINLEYER